jgi:hypothetical protein
MYSLQAKIEEQLQLCLHLNIIILKNSRTNDNSYLSIKVKHVEGRVWNFICRKEERKTLSKTTITIFKNRFTYNKPKG